MKKTYTWEEKIESLVTLAKAVGRYTNAEKDTDYYLEARFKLLEAYDDFCEWRHDEPYVVDEIKAMLHQKEYTDKLTGVRLTVNHDNPEYPGHPKLTLICPEHHSLSIEQVNDALSRLRHQARISSDEFPGLTTREDS